MVGMGYVDTSQVYHLVRGQSVIKLYVIYNMLDVREREREEKKPCQCSFFRFSIVWLPLLVKMCWILFIGFCQRRLKERETYCQFSSMD